MFVDEAVWGGNKQQAGSLKKMITERTRDIEQKHGARYQIDAYTNYIFASNESWVVPAGNKARRFCAMEFNNEKAEAGNQDYFACIRKVPPEAFASYLHHFDISDFNVRDVPATALLRDQKERRFSNAAAFWNQILCEGAIEACKGPGPNWTREWSEPMEIPNQDLFQAYQEFLGNQTDRSVKNHANLIKELRSYCTFENSRRTQRRALGKVVSVTMLPSLKNARLEFCKKMNDPKWFVDESSTQDEHELE